MRFPKIDKRSILLFLAVLGPGIITSNVDNDAGGITTYSLAGAYYGYSLLWSLIPITIALIVIQEMCARMGVVTGKGLADLIRENFGVRLTFFIMIALVLANLGNIMAEFAGIAAGSEIFGVSRYISVPLSAIFVWWLVVKGTYKSVEKVFLIACLFYVSYILSGLLANPPWREVLMETVTPSFQADTPHLLMLIGLVGTTIAPWMQFYLQASVVEKGIKTEDYRYSRLDVIFGGIVVAIVAYFIIVTCAATIHAHGIKIESAADAAVALSPLAGHYSSWLFAFGLLNASLFAASILPLSTSFYVCEAFGWDSGVNKRFNEAPQFYGLYTILIVVGAGVILYPDAPLLNIMLISQVINGILLPFILISMLLLINNKKIMGNYVNSMAWNAITWVTSMVMIFLTLLLVLTTLFPNLL